MKTVRLGIIGIGTMGRFHLSKLGEIKNIELTAVCDLDPERGRQAAATYHCAAYEDHRKLLKDQVCDAVLIVTPHYAHTTIGIDALRAGLHVLVEKPISVHKSDCERLIAAHTNRKQIFAAMFNQRTDPRYRKRHARQAGPDHVDHHRLVPHGRLLRLQRLASDVGRRGRRRPAEPVPAQSRSLAMDVRHAAARPRLL